MLFFSLVRCLLCLRRDQVSFLVFEGGEERGHLVPAVLQCTSPRHAERVGPSIFSQCSLARIRIFGTPALTEENLRQASPSALLRLLRQVPVSLKESASMLHAGTAASGSSFPRAKL